MGQVGLSCGVPHTPYVMVNPILPSCPTVPDRTVPWSPPYTICNGQSYASMPSHCPVDSPIHHMYWSIPCYRPVLLSCGVPHTLYVMVNPMLPSLPTVLCRTGRTVLWSPPYTICNGQSYASIPSYSSM